MGASARPFIQRVEPARCVALCSIGDGLGMTLVKSSAPAGDGAWWHGLQSAAGLSCTVRPPRQATVAGVLTVSPAP